MTKIVRRLTDGQFAIGNIGYEGAKAKFFPRDDKRFSSREAADQELREEEEKEE